jgi:sec-independent protein translocase protein TatA
MPFNIGIGELVLVLLIVLLVFGASRLPAIGEGVGKAIKNFKRGISSDDNIEVESPKKKRVSERSSARIVEEDDEEDAEVESKKG